MSDTTAPPDHASPAAPPRDKVQLALTIVGWVLTLPTCAMLLFSASFKLRQPDWMMEAMAKDGWPAHAILPIGIAETVSTMLFLFPRTAVLGAILLTGYLGGAIATHVRQDTGFLRPAAMGVIVWIALVLREPRLRPLAPWRTLKK